MVPVHWESLWRGKFQSEGWSDRASEQFKFCLASSTLQYNSKLEKLRQFCLDLGCAFSCDAPTLAECLYFSADSSERPHSQIKIVMAAFGHLSRVLDFHIPNFWQLISTSVPRSPSGVIPIEKFANLFKSWPTIQILTSND